MTSHWLYFLWAIPVAIVLLWPAARFIVGINQLGSAGVLAAVPITAFSLGMAASVLSAPLFQRGGAARMLSADAGMLAGLMGFGLMLLAVMYVPRTLLVIATAASGAIGTAIAVWNIRKRSVPPEKPARPIAVAGLNVVLVTLLGYLMLSLRWST